MRFINSIIIDDEEHARKNLKLLLERYCTNVRILDVFGNPLEAIPMLENQAIDIVFIDINMPEINGLDFVEDYENRTFEIIFVTAYEDFTLRALRLGAIDYITKPISVRELQAAIERYMAKSQADLKEDRYKLTLPHSKGTSVISIKDILYLQADTYTTTLYLKDNQQLMVSKNIKQFEEALANNYFCRIHKSFIVNLNQIESYGQNDFGGFVIMKNDISLPISRRKRNDFVDKMQKFVK